MAIKKDITITVQNEKSIMSEEVYIYQGDKNIDLYFTIVDDRFMFTGTKKYSFTVKKPDGNIIAITTLTSMDIDNKVKFTITEAMADELTEIGVYGVLIHLHDDVAKISIPEIYFTVKEPLVCTNAITNTGFVQSAILDNINDKLIRLDVNGRYDKTIWNIGDTITKDNLNKIENELNDLNLTVDSIKNTNAVITFDANSRVTKIQHKNISDNVIIREDIFTYTSNTITETRRIISTGSTITYVCNY